MENLKEERLRRGLTQIDMAIKCEVSLASYRMWEQGVTTPNEENMKKLEKTLDEE